MPNVIDATGLTVDTREELLTFFTDSYKAIYGSDITLDSDTPDGQWLNINIQAILDLEDLLVEIYNTFDPDNAFGVVLDQRVALNGIQRQAGTYTITNVTLVITQSLNLYGLDQTTQPVYTVADNAGNRWFLQVTQLGVTAGTYVYSFRAETPGANLTVPNTIQVPVTIVLGVQSINNPTTYTTLGINEESDAELKIRRQKSVSLSSQGYYAGLLAALENINGVTFAYIEENTTGSTNTDGVPGHSIWVIVAGSGADADIADAIYRKRNAGCGMYGSTSYDVTQVDGSTFTVFWDEVSQVPLFIKFTANSLDGTNPPNIAAITSGLVTDFVPGVAAQVNINELSTLVQELDANTLVTSAGFSIETVQTITFSGIAASGAFKLSYGSQSTASISWNDNVATIQSRLRALTGLGSITAAGSIASQSVVVTMTGVTTPSMIGYNTNTLLTAGSAVVSLAFTSAFTNTLTPSAKNFEFQLSTTNIVITPMILSAPSIGYVITSGLVVSTTLAITASGPTVQFTGLGGYGTLVYSKDSGNGSISSSTGVYTPGAAGTVILRVTDALGNTTTCTVTVT